MSETLIYLKGEKLGEIISEDKEKIVFSSLIDLPV